MSLTEDELKSITQAQATNGPQPGDVYRHWKGGLYVVWARSIKEDTFEPLVTYRSNAHGTFWTRTVANFTEQSSDWAEIAAVPVPRFRRVED